MAWRRGGFPEPAAGPSRRIIGITIISFLALMFTPTKWTHHFGVFAGLAGSLGALAAVAVTAAGMKSRRNRAVFAALVLFLVAAWFHFSGRDTGQPDGRLARLRHLVESPLAIAAWVLVVFEVFSLTAAMIVQYPAWTVGRSN